MDSQRPFPPFVPSLSLKQQNQTTPPHSPSSALSLGKRVPSDSMEEQNLQAAEEKKEKEEKKKKNVEKEEKEEEKKKDSEGKKVKRVINSIRDKEEDKIRYDDRKMCACRECPKLYFSTNRKIYCSKKCQYREQNLILGRVKENKEKVLERQLKIQGLRKNKKVMKTNIDEDVK